MRVRLLFAVALVIGAAALPSTASAKTWSFKVDLVNVKQDAQEWRHVWRWPYDDLCGSDHVYYVYKGQGMGELRAKRRNAGKVTFKSLGGGILQSTEFRAPGTGWGDATWTTEQFGNPGPGCDPGTPPMTDTTNCAPFVKKPGTARMFLLVQRGRLVLTGGFYYKPGETPCGDPTIYTGAVGFGGRPARRDVDDLIRSKRVRSIDLTATSHEPFTVRNLAEPGANTRELEGSGQGDASWRVKLTRVRK